MFFRSDVAALESFVRYFDALSHIFSACALGSHVPLLAERSTAQRLTSSFGRASFARILHSAGIVWPGSDGNAVAPTQERPPFAQDVSPPVTKATPTASAATGSIRPYELELLKFVTQRYQKALDPHAFDAVVLYCVFDDSTSDPAAHSAAMSPSNPPAALSREANATLATEPPSPDRPPQTIRSTETHTARESIAPHRHEWMRYMCDWILQFSQVPQQQPLVLSLRTTPPPHLSVVLHMLPRSVIDKFVESDLNNLSSAMSGSVGAGVTPTDDLNAALRAVAMDVFAKVIRKPYNIDKLGALVRHCCCKIS